MADKKISALTASSLPLAGTEVLPIVQSSATVKVAVDDLTVKNIRSNATTGILQVAGPAAAATRTMTTPDANFSAARIDAGQTFTGAQNVENGSGTNQRLLYLKQTNDFGYSFNIDSVSTGDLTLKSVNSGVEANILKASRASGTVTFADNVIIGTAGKGIDFSANTGSAGMTSELLNWYEEGTWTATISDGTTDATMNAGRRTGTYTRVGRQVTVTGYIATTSMTGVTGNLRMKGLPFTAGNNDVGGGAVGYADQMTLIAGQVMVLQTQNGADYIVLRYWNGGTTSNMTGTQWGAIGEIGFTLTYFV
jgi:hypothetical protein